MSNYRNDIKEYLISVNPDISEYTVKLYSLKLNQINKDLNGDKPIDREFKLFDDSNKIIKYINELGGGVDKKLAYLNAIMFVHKKANTDKIYQKRRNELNKIKKEKYMNNTKTESFIDYDELLAAAPIPDFTKSIKSVFNQMLLYMVMRYPLRLALYDIKFTKIKKNIDPEQNYIYIAPKKMEFIMNNFKNVKTFGKQTILVDKQTETVIRNYIKFLKNNNIDSDYLLINYYNDVPLLYSSRDVYSVVLKKLLDKLFPGKNVSTNNIRDSYATKIIKSPEYNTMTNAEKENLHKRILHGIETANIYYNKV